MSKAMFMGQEYEGHPSAKKAAMDGLTVTGNAANLSDVAFLMQNYDAHDVAELGTFWSTVFDTRGVIEKNAVRL